MTGRAVRYGFLGAGSLATGSLAPAVHAAAGSTLQAVAARSAERAQGLAPQGAVYTDYDALLADPDVDVVYINLANDQHKPWTLAALAAGKHVLCEKPLGLDADEVAEMFAAARAADRKLVEAFWYRWHPRVRAAVDLVREGAIGQVEAVESNFTFDDDLTGNFRLDPALGGGALYDVGCYAISAAVWACGGDGAMDGSFDQSADHVVDASVVRAPSGVDLTTAAQLGFPSGAVASVQCGMNGPAAQWLRIIGSKGTLELPGDSFSLDGEPSELLLGHGGLVHHHAFPAERTYQLMIEAVSAAVNGEPAFLVDEEHSLAVARTMDAVRAATSSS